MSHPKYGISKIETMTKIYFLLLSGLFSTMALSAQITIDGSDIPPFGAVLAFAEDTLVAGLEPGPSGAGQSWNFSSLATQNTFQNTVLDPATTPFANQFPNATFSLLGTDGFYSYSQLTNEALLVLGGSAPLPDGSSATARFDPPQQLIPAPATFGASFDNEFGFTIFLDGSAFGVDSVQVRESGTQSAEIDAWGSLTIPSGTYETLRQRVETITVDSILVLFFGNYIPFSIITDTTITYEWWAKNGRAQVLSLEYDAAGNPLTATHLAGYSESSVAPQASFSYELLGNGEVQFTDASQFGPIAWLWNFGDGASSMEQNPSHIYATSGMYEVCLTVANAAGQDVLCQNIEIVLSSNDEARSAGVRAYPSPFTDAFTVELGALSGQAVRLSLFNNLGQLSRQEWLPNAPQRLRMPVAELQPGVYRLVVEVGGKRVKVISVSKL